MMKPKKLAALFVTFTLFSGVTALAEAPYTDLGGLKSRAAIDYLYDNQCLDFAAGKTFAPQQVLTRGDLAQLIYSVALKLPESPLVFSDAPTPKANDAMAAMAAQGILKGYEDGSFHPDEPVTREEFAAVLYRYLKYCGLEEIENHQLPYGDIADVAPENRTAVEYLQRKDLMTTTDNLFRPREGMTRAAAAETIYHMMHSDADYVSHVDVESQVIRALNAEYGSMPAFFQQGTLYWDGDKLVLGFRGSPRMFLKQRLKKDVSRYDVLVFRHVRFARADYDQLMTRAINCIVSEEGVQNYVGSVPDYKNETIDVIVRRPLADTTVQKLNERIGKGVVRIHDVRTAAMRPQPASPAGETKKADTDTNKDLSHSPLYDEATNAAVNSVIRDAMK
ncbi:S-layer homology domain-containing protein [uncultured Megasphaera sp.]|uniref:S-layer homology domain-containing protein n=1 Tax=uncultured Megasphaera sp. TaxID=165188 RepID=UPI0026095E84|nr:S-layer homology domain-containing protein [uncultured Megasphaera sp.]